jgi:hypothetical protein
VVDDQQDMRDLIVRALEGDQYAVSDRHDRCGGASGMIDLRTGRTLWCWIIRWRTWTA